MKLVFVRSHDLLLWFHDTVLQSASTENKPAARRTTCPDGEAYFRAALEDNRALLVRDDAGHATAAHCSSGANFKVCLLV
jgi:hypothetical protein